MDYQDMFKQKFIGTAFKLTFASWFKITLAYFIVYLLTMAITIFALSSVLPGFNPLLLASGSSRLMTISSIPMGLFSSVLQVVAVFSGFLIVSLLLASWYYNFGFTAVHLKVSGIKANFGKVFIKSFSIDVFKILLINLVYFVFTFITLFSVFYSMRISSWTIIPISLIYTFILLKTILTMPVYVIGRKGFAESFNFSFTNITSLRVLKILLAIIVLFVVLFGVSFLLNFLPNIKPIDLSTIIILIASQQLVSIIVYGFLGSLFISSISGLYYRYNGGAKVIKNEKVAVDKEIQETDSDDDEPYDMSKNLFAGS